MKEGIWNELYLYLIRRLEFSKISRNVLARPVMGTIFLVYIYVCTKKIVIERTRNLIYLKFVATDFFPKIISPSAGENSGDLA